MKSEAYATEIGITLKSIKNARKGTKNWTKTKNALRHTFIFLSAKSYIKKEPYGTVLIMHHFKLSFSTSVRTFNRYYCGR